MPTYEYRCPRGHLTQRQQSMTDEIPAELTCHDLIDSGEPDTPTITDRLVHCGQIARRIFSPPAAIHYRGGGFYATDVKSRFERKRRPNAGDDLAIPSEAAVTRAEGAEKDNDPSGFNSDGTIKRV